MMKKSKIEKAIGRINSGNVSTVIRLDAGNDRNGNPRRVYVAISEGGDIIGAWNEGYCGDQCVPLCLHVKAKLAPTFETTAAEYKGILKEFGMPDCYSEYDKLGR